MELSPLVHFPICHLHETVEDETITFFLYKQLMPPSGTLEKIGDILSMYSRSPLYVRREKKIYFVVQ